MLETKDHMADLVLENATQHVYNIHQHVIPKIYSILLGEYLVLKSCIILFL